MKIGAVVQRYGASVAGGAERLAREICTRLARHDDVTVLTTTARDYVTWRNELPEGEEIDERVRVRRFPVAAERDPSSFAALSEQVFASRPTLDDEYRWVRAQGPDSPALYAALWRERDRFDAWLFFTYLYAPTLFGLAIAPEHAVLVPLAHNEAPIYLRVYKNLFRVPSRLLFQTAEEQALVERVVPRNPVPASVVGYGVDLPTTADSAPWPESLPPGTRYVLYLGRLDPSKGILELLDAFASFRAVHGSELKLVLAGEAAMDVPAVPDVAIAGFVSEDERDRLLTHARLIVQPSRFESLSIVALEAWARARPVLGNAASDVVAGQIGRSGGGFVYRDAAELLEILDLARRDAPELADRGRSGLDFVRRVGAWDTVLAHYREALRDVASRSRREAIRAN